MRHIRTFLLAATIIFEIGIAANAQYTNPQRPLVFVPGILGSRLCDPTNKIIWGTASSLANFGKLELGVPTQIDLHACGLVDEIQILGSLWTHNTYKSWMDELKKIGYSTEQNNLFIFAYDWRLSNFDNAKALDVFVTRHIGPDKNFDMIAHSMGGLTCRIYLDEYASAKSVEQIIYLGTPFLGSMNTFGTLKEGWGWPLTAMAGGQDVVARVVLSFPSMLEMLPRYDECCYIRKSDGSRLYLDIFNPATWRSLNWLPTAYSNPAKFSQFSSTLERSKSLTPLLSKPAPAGVYETIFASDIYDTLRLLGMKEGATRPENWIFTSSKGDGTVPVWSVARRIKSDGYSNTLPSFAKYEHLFDDMWVDNAIFRALIAAKPSEPFKIAAPGRPAIEVTINGFRHAWPVNIAKIVVSKEMVHPGDLVTAELTIELQDTVSELAPGLYTPPAFLVQSGQEYPLEVHEVTSSDELAAKQLRYTATGTAGANEGVGVVEFRINGPLQPSQAFYVSSSTN